MLWCYYYCCCWYICKFATHIYGQAWTKNIREIDEKRWQMANEANTHTNTNVRSHILTPWAMTASGKRSRKVPSIMRNSSRSGITQRIERARKGTKHIENEIITHKQKQQSRYVFRCVFFYYCCGRCCCCNMFSSLVVQLKQSNIGKRKSQSKSIGNRFANILHKLQIDQWFYFQSMP